jgi:hypothetical protein
MNISKVFVRGVNVAGSLMCVVGAINAGQTYRLLRGLAAEAITRSEPDPEVVSAIEALPNTIDLSIIAIFFGILLLLASDWLREKAKKQGGFS